MIGQATSTAVQSRVPPRQTAMSPNQRLANGLEAACSSIWTFSIEVVIAVAMMSSLWVWAPGLPFYIEWGTFLFPVLAFSMFQALCQK